MKNLTEFENKLGYKFKNIKYLETALTHSSYVNERREAESYERLEFLGDSVLGMVVAERLYLMFPDETEGELSKKKSALVQKRSLEEFAKRLGVEEYLLLSKGELMSGGFLKSSILEDCFEAIIGAIYLDSDFYEVRRWLDMTITEEDYRQPRLEKVDYKTALQELVQKNPSDILEYRQVSVEGPDHARIFTTEAVINGVTAGVGKGNSKKAAEQAAAKNTIENKY